MTDQKETEVKKEEEVEMAEKEEEEASSEAGSDTKKRKRVVGQEKVTEIFAMNDQGNFVKVGEVKHMRPIRAKKEKPLSNLARKKADERYFMNGKGRYVSMKKSEIGKKNVQSRAIKMGRDILGLNGRMVLLNKGVEGKALLDLTRIIRQALKDGMDDAKAKEKFTPKGKEILEEKQREADAEEQKA